MTRAFIDIETKLGHPAADRLLLVGYAVDEGPVKVLDQLSYGDGYGVVSDPAHADELWQLLSDPLVTKVTQTKYDLRYLLLSGWDVKGDLHDTTVMAHMLNENTPLDIDWLAWRYAGLAMDKRLHRVSGKVFFRADDGTEWDLETIDQHMVMDELGVWRQFGEYNVRDVDGLRKTYFGLLQRLEESEWDKDWLTERVPYTNVLLRMETRGLPIDVDATLALASEYAPEAERLSGELIAEAGLPPSFNINSGDQLANYLFSRVVTFNDALVLGADAVACLKSCLDGEHEDCPAVVRIDAHAADPSIFTEHEYHTVDLLPEGFVIDKLGRDRVHGHWTVKGRGLTPTPPTKNKLTGELGKRPSTASPELLYMHAGDPWVKKLCLEYRKLETLLTTFLTRWPVQAHEGRLYGRFNQTGTVTGRLSSSGPNLQNVPARGARGKAIRGLFRAPEGYLLVAGDYDQLEMRIMASLSGDPEMTRIFREGKDPHLITAQSIFGQSVEAHSETRDLGKLLNYTMIYGAGPRKVAQTLSLAGYATDKDTAKGYLAELARFYRVSFKWKQHEMEKAKRHGYVKTIGGTRRRLRANFKDTANWKLVGYGERQAVNAEIQGSAADIIRRVMCACEAEFPELHLLIQVHDELVWQVYAGLWTPTVQEELSAAGERWSGFDLAVPLVFEPHAGDTWAAAKAGLDLSPLLEDDPWDE